MNKETNKLEWVYPDPKQERRLGIVMDGKGIVCLSGFGDGSYDLYARKNKEGQIIGLRINFINLHEEDDN